MPELKELSEDDRLAAHILEDDDSLENRNEVVNSLLDDPVSHYRCSWAYGGDPLVFVWENTEECEGSAPERPPDQVGCLQCGNMAYLDEVEGGEDIWKARNY